MSTWKILEVSKKKYYLRTSLSDQSALASQPIIILTTVYISLEICLTPSPTFPALFIDRELFKDYRFHIMLPSGQMLNQLLSIDYLRLVLGSHHNQELLRRNNPALFRAR